MKKQITINDLYHLLSNHYENQIESWWPFDSVYEMVIGAILVQNTTWTNTEKSLAQLRKYTHFKPDAIRQLSQEKLIELIHSSGFHQNKSRAILEFFEWIAPYQDDFHKIKETFSENLRDVLLSKRGIGPETADVILLYAFNTSAFIADSYARRLFEKLHAPCHMTYQGVKDFAERNGHLTLEQWGAFHGWIIRFAQVYLKPKQNWEGHFLCDYQLIENPE